MSSKSIVAVLGTVMALPVLAVTEPQAVDLGPVKFVPTLGISQTYDDNIFQQPIGETDAWVSRVKPQLQFIAQKDANVGAVTYMGDYGFFSSGSQDDYDDHTLSGDGYIEANGRNRFTVAASAAKLHDPRGTGGSEGINAGTRAVPDEYDAMGYSLKYDFGSDEARFGFGLSAGTDDVEYQNNRDETQFRDRNNTSYAAQLSGRLASRTKVFVEFAVTDIGYDVAPQLRDGQGNIISVVPGVPLVGATLDSEERNISIGAEWEATGKTTGSIKIGRLAKDFDSAVRDDADFINWEASILWTPRTYSYLTFTASKAPQETNGTGAFILMRSYDVNWTHDWSSYWHTDVSVGLGSDTFQNDPREDDRETFAASINYDYDTWMNVGLGYSYNSRNSNNNLFDFNRSQLMLSFDVSL
jgi:hypothetical protein